MKNNAGRNVATRSSAATGPLADRAADWLSRRDAGFSPAEEAEFALWLAADVRNAEVVAEVERAWSLIAVRRQGDRGADAMIEALAHRARGRQARRAKFVVTVAGLAAAAALAFLLRPALSPVREARPPALPSTVVHRPALQTLPDGSIVEFNAGAEIAVEFVSDRRNVRLLGGEAHFSVAKDSSRPFVVTVGAVEVRAVGTQFSVHHQNRKVEVLVNEGRVAIGAGPGHESSSYGGASGSVELRPLEVVAGSRVVVSFESGAGHVPVLTQLSQTDVEQALAWRGKRVEFNGTRLGDAVALFNAANRVQLSLSDKELASLRVSGTYWINDPAGFARLVESSFGLRSARVSNDAIALGK